ncbi:MAG: MBL fold metallo-hydrolase [Parcubacteria group bacterium]|nr:MBL fold metallo-hydrolase [Parcubacteria group bacterium]
MKDDKHLFGILFLVLVFDVWLYVSIISFYFSPDLRVYFLSVGQGDATLLVTPDGKRFLIDGGPGKRTASELGNVLPPWARRIDAILVTHPQSDHFAGFIDVLRTYRVGYVFGNGDENDTQTFGVFKKTLREQGLNPVVLHTGVTLDISWMHMLVLSPKNDAEVKNAKDKNDSGIVARVEFAGKSFLFTADVPKEILKRIPQEFLAVDILKVPHHGSKTGLDEELMGMIKPKVSVIEVGKNNYGHPKKEILNILIAHTEQLFRTDQERAMVTITPGGKIAVDAQ